MKKFLKYVIIVACEDYNVCVVRKFCFEHFLAWKLGVIDLKLEVRGKFCYAHVMEVVMDDE